MTSDNPIKENYALMKYAQLEKAPALWSKDIYTGIYRGVCFEITNYSREPNTEKDKWCHYIRINIDQQLPDEFKERFWLKPLYDSVISEEKRLHYNYSESIISNLEWHGGCTYYNKESGPDDIDRVVKIGCDYQHYWDEGHDYDLDFVYQQVKMTIASLWTLVGKLKIRSWGDGKYRYLEEFEE